MVARTQKIIQQAAIVCHAHGCQLTPKRKLLLMGLIKSGKALSAYELIDFCKTQYDEVVPAISVYRILDLFQQLHLVHKLNSINKFTVCSHILDKDEINQPTVFLICRDCHKVKELHVSANLIDALKQDIDDKGFQVISSQLELECQCDDCVSNTAKQAQH